MVRFALTLPDMAEPDDLVGLGTTADRAGWDGVFLWDHVFGGPAFPVPIADPWVVLGALATTTERVRLGTAVHAGARGAGPRSSPGRRSRSTGCRMDA